MSKVVLIFMNILVVVGYFLDLFQADLELVILRHKDEKCRDMDGNIKFLTHNLKIHVPRLTLEDWRIILNFAPRQLWFLHTKNSFEHVSTSPA